MLVPSKFSGSSFKLSSSIIPFVRNSFSYASGVCQKLFSRFFSPEAIIPDIIIYLSRWFIQVLLIRSSSSRSLASKSPQTYLFFYFFPVIHSPSSVIFEFFPVIHSLSSFNFRILTVDRSRFFFFGYHFNSFVLFNPTGGSWRLSQVLCYTPP